MVLYKAKVELLIHETSMVASTNRNNDLKELQPRQQLLTNVSGKGFYVAINVRCQWLVDIENVRCLVRFRLLTISKKIKLFCNTHRTVLRSWRYLTGIKQFPWFPERVRTGRRTLVRQYETALGNVSVTELGHVQLRTPNCSVHIIGTGHYYYSFYLFHTDIQAQSCGWNTPF